MGSRVATTLSRAQVERPLRGTRCRNRPGTVAADDLEIMEEEKKLMEALDEEDRQQRQRQAAAEEHERQSKADDAWLEEMTERVEARKYRDWEEWELHAAMTHPMGAPSGCQRVRVQGQVEAGPRQCMEWAIRPGETVQLQIQLMAASTPAADGEEGEGLAPLQASGQRDDGDRGPQHRGSEHTSNKGYEASGVHGPATEEIVHDGSEGANNVAPGKRKWSELPVTENVAVLEDSQV